MGYLALSSTVQTVRWRTPSAKLAAGSGSTCIIGLNAIRRQAGERWESIRASVTQRLETLLRQRLSPEDFFVPVGEVSYLVVMPAAAPEDGLICSLRIAYELYAGLFGSCAIQHLNLARAESVADDVLEIEPLNRAEAIRLAKKAELAFAAQPGERRHMRKAAPPAAPSRITLGYLPVWDVRYEVIRAYRCLPAGVRRPKLEHPPVQQAQTMSQTGLTVLQLAVETLERHLARDERFLLNLPVSYEMLCAPVARMEFVAACRQLPCTLRPYFAFVIEEVPVGVPQSRLLDLVAAIRGFAGMIAAKIPARLPDFTAFRGAGLKALGIELSGLSAAESGFDINKLTAETRRLGISAFLDEVPDAKTVRTAMESGVQWMSGPAIAAAVDDPGPLTRLSSVQLLRERAEA